VKNNIVNKYDFKLIFAEFSDENSQIVIHKDDVRCFDAEVIFGDNINNLKSIDIFDSDRGFFRNESEDPAIALEDMQTLYETGEFLYYDLYWKGQTKAKLKELINLYEMKVKNG